MAFRLLTNPENTRQDTDLEHESCNVAHPLTLVSQPLPGGVSCPHVALLPNGVALRAILLFSPLPLSAHPLCSRLQYTMKINDRTQLRAYAYAAFFKNRRTAYVRPYAASVALGGVVVFFIRVVKNSLGDGSSFGCYYTCTSGVREVVLFISSFGPLP